MSKTHVYLMLQVVVAAALFGASAPLAKVLLGEVDPVPLAGFLYLGSGTGLLLFKAVRWMDRQSAGVEALLSKEDVPWLIGAVLAGGVAAPIVLMLGLRHTHAATASLLLNFEGAATALIAALIFKEAIGGRVLWAVAAITAASVLLSWDGNSEWGFSLGAIGVLGACALWGVDNNFTRNISAKDPLAIVLVKGLGAGAFSLILAVILRSPFPAPRLALAAMALGSVSYGLSIVLFILAMRGLGAARTSALFGTAPFAGTALSFMLFGGVPGTLFFISIPLMIIGAILLLGEKHSHTHAHGAVEHEHRHLHQDGHHLHDHGDAQTLTSRSHSHWHRHVVIEHEHPHTPDIHHRHVHGKLELIWDSEKAHAAILRYVLFNFLGSLGKRILGKLSR